MPKFMCVVLMLSGSAAYGEHIDRCWLDPAGVLHCSTPGRRAGAAQRALLNAIAGYDIDERQRYLRAAARAWGAQQKEPCRSIGVDIQNISNAYGSPERDDGLGISELKGECDKAFALWLFRQENHGMPPGEVARVNSILMHDISDVKGSEKKCPEEVREVLKASRAWLAHVKATEKRDPSIKKLWNARVPKDGELHPAVERANELYQEREEAMKSLNACLGDG